jgi:hypothetical protein
MQCIALFTMPASETRSRKAYASLQHPSSICGESRLANPKCIHIQPNSEVSSFSVVKVGSTIAALHVIILSFLFFKPPGLYFFATRLCTVVAWGIRLPLARQPRWASMLVSLIFSVTFQQIAYHYWLSGKITGLWPLVQFLALQFVVALPVDSSRDRLHKES